MCLFSVSALAESKMYGGIQYGMATYSKSGVTDVDLGALIFRIGQKVNKNFAFEGRVGLGISGGSGRTSTTSFTFDIDDLIGAYALGIIPVANGVDLYGLVGFTSGNFTAKVLGVSVPDAESSMSYGVGIDIAATKDVSWNVEYVNYLDDNYNINSISVGANYAF